METTFITIHDLSLDARLLYASNSIGDILGYRPEDVVGRSCWEYFHPDEIPFAQTVHGRGIQLDKAAVLSYCQIKNKAGQWVGCECVFTVVHDVLVGCTSIYRRGIKSQKRAMDAPIIRQLFSSSPRDPRYHMLSYISSKFSQGPKPHTHEPRAALFLNRFTRTLTIMYATNGLESLLGIPADQLNGKSFYYCIQENCLQEAIRCLESAKANDSIAYLRFWFRDPRQDDRNDQDETMSDAHSTDADDDDDGGVQLDTHMDNDSSDYMAKSASSGLSSGRRTPSRRGVSIPDYDSTSSATTHSKTPESVFDEPATTESSNSSVPTQGSQSQNYSREERQPPEREIELEAVVSCTSDGLVVILRGARPFVLDSLRQPPRIAEPMYQNGLFASPWANQPIMPTRELDQQNPYAASHQSIPTYSQNVQGNANLSGPATADFMNSIREVAVFAWALTGINGSLSQYSRGKPKPGAQPFNGMPVWDPNAQEGKHETIQT